MESECAVIGSAQGIGNAISKRLLDGGCIVIGVDSDQGRPLLNSCRCKSASRTSSCPTRSRVFGRCFAPFVVCKSNDPV